MHNTARKSSDNLPPYPSDNHHCSDVVYWREGDVIVTTTTTSVLLLLLLLPFYSHYTGQPALAVITS